MIYARRSVVSLHAFKGSPQIAQRVDLVHQAEPLASQHSLFESRQHPFRPDLGFDPGPSRPNLSGGTSPLSGHCVRELLRLFRHVSTFLRSLRSLAVTPLLRYYGRSDSCPPGSSALLGHELRLLHGQVSLIHAPRPSDHSVSNHRRTLRLAKARYLSADRIEIASLRVFSLRELEASAFTRSLAPITPAESSFSSYGLAVHLRLLSTPSRDDAVTFGYQVTLTRRGLSPLRPSALSGARVRQLAAALARARLLAGNCARDGNSPRASSRGGKRQQAAALQSFASASDGNTLHSWFL